MDKDQWIQSEKVAALRDKNNWYMPYSANPGCVRGFAFHNQRVYASVEVGGLMVSDDYGRTWDLAAGSSGKPREIPGPGGIHPDVHSVASHSASADLVFAPTGGGFFTSEDGGTTWENKYNAYSRAVWVDPQDATHMLLGPAEGVGRGGRIEETIDTGETWHLRMSNINDQWTVAMVERFVGADGEIYAILSNGKILTAHADDFSWQYLLPGIGNAVMVALF